jgi:hypothetical protein
MKKYLRRRTPASLQGEGGRWATGKGGGFCPGGGGGGGGEWEGCVLGGGGGGVGPRHLASLASQTCACSAARGGPGGAAAAAGSISGSIEHAGDVPVAAGEDYAGQLPTKR